jgi:hypothetical protein
MVCLPVILITSYEIPIRKIKKLKRSFYYGRVPTEQNLNNLNIRTGTWTFYSFQFRSRVLPGFFMGPSFYGLRTCDVLTSNFLPAVAVQCHVRPPVRCSVTYCKQSSRGSSFAGNLLQRLFRLVASRNYVAIVSQNFIWQRDLQLSEQNRLSSAGCSAAFFISAWI